ncbi:hypothetical protein M422DRAFT_780465 [Sphaerobolus stellatus SS14]|uniref:Uncharacterized protein n=1 Tax=Sphaerobolus stellatus (strain SS14) TaxID=990650 RepID=A0A0C9UD34_SPHS4|nr:hypothetical protein M422DRAFT_780465 [Sphaerobolus stellatus SS14]
MKFSLVAISAAFIAGVSAVPAGTPTASAPQATESLGWAQHWIKTESGQFLQSATPWQPGDAVLGSPLTAGEFNIVSTSLVDTVHTETMTYATVAPVTAGATMLKVSFEEGLITPASGGTFAWSGTEKTLTWSRPDSTFTGWIACDNVLFANLKSTVPAGCSSVTISSFVSTFATDSA